MRRIYLIALSAALISSQVLAGCGSCMPVHCAGADAGISEVSEIPEVPEARSEHSGGAPSHCDESVLAVDSQQVDPGVPSGAADPQERSGAMDCGPETLSAGFSCFDHLWSEDQVSTISSWTLPGLLPIGHSFATRVDPAPPDRARDVHPTRAPHRLFELHAAYLI